MEVYVSLYPCGSERPTDLAFDANQLFTIINKLDGEWWEVRSEGKSGYIRPNYISPVVGFLLQILVTVLLTKFAEYSINAKRGARDSILLFFNFFLFW